MSVDRLNSTLDRYAGWTKRHRRGLAVAGFVALLAIPGYAGLNRLNEGVGNIDPSGEGWHLVLRSSAEGLELEYASRYNGINPLPCRFEGPLTYTTFTQWRERWSVGLTTGFKKTWSLGRISNNPANLCEPAPWPI